MNLSTVNHRIRTLLGAIEQELSQLLPALSLPEAGGSKHVELKQKLQNWEMQINYLVQDLLSARHFLGVAANRVLSLSHEQRFAAQQSVSDRIRSIDNILREVTRLRNRLDDLLDRVGRPTRQEAINLIQTLSGNVYDDIEVKQKVTNEMLALVGQPTAPSISRPAPPGDPSNLLVALAVVGRILQMFAMRLAK